MPRPVYTGNRDGAVVSGFFIAPMTSVLRTIVRARDVAARKESGLSLTQGERLREGSAPSDKQGNRLDEG